MSNTKFTLPSETPESVGKRISLLRRERGITQAQLADKMKVSRSLIASIETGAKSPDVKLWFDLSVFFGVSTDYIAGTSTNRTLKTFTGCIKIDLDCLNEQGRDLLYKYYEFLISVPEFCN